MSTGDKRLVTKSDSKRAAPQPRPHPCNDELEELINGLLQWPPLLNEPWMAFRACIRIHGWFPEKTDRSDVQEMQRDGTYADGDDPDVPYRSDR